MYCSENIIIEKIALIKHAQYDRTSMIRHGTPELQVGGEKNSNSTHPLWLQQNRSRQIPLTGTWHDMANTQAMAQQAHQG